MIRFDHLGAGRSDVLLRQARASHRSSLVAARRLTPTGSQITARGRRRRTPGRPGPTPNPFPPSSRRPQRGRSRARVGHGWMWNPVGVRPPGTWPPAPRGAPPATAGCVVRRLRRRADVRRIDAGNAHGTRFVRIFPAGVIGRAFQPDSIRPDPIRPVSGSKARPTTDPTGRSPVRPVASPADRPCRNRRPRPASSSSAPPDGPPASLDRLASPEPLPHRARERRRCRVPAARTARGTATRKPPHTPT
jgi:hypothetical protein